MARVVFFQTAMGCILHEYQTKYLIFLFLEFFKENDYSPVICEYHILYNPSYLCPDMFFNMWSTGNYTSIHKHY